MDIKRLAIPDVMLLTPRLFGDARGWFQESYNRRALSEVGIEAVFVQDNHSFSAAAGTVRGLHYQWPPMAQAKLVRVVRGAVFDVVVDIRRGSPTYGRHVSAELSAENRRQMWVPEGFLHGFCTLEPHTEVVYKATNYYAPDYDHGITWDDPDLRISWPVAAADAILSDKDRTLPAFRDHASVFGQ